MRCGDSLYSDAILVSTEAVYEDHSSDREEEEEPPPPPPPLPSPVPPCPLPSRRPRRATSTEWVLDGEAIDAESASTKYLLLLR
jgi:hypothetical protein